MNIKKLNEQLQRILQENNASSYMDKDLWEDLYFDIDDFDPDNNYLEVSSYGMISVDNVSAMDWNFLSGARFDEDENLSLTANVTLVIDGERAGTLSKPYITLRMILMDDQGNEIKKPLSQAYRTEIPLDSAGLKEFVIYMITHTLERKAEIFSAKVNL